jgi:predicted nucleic acid-binding protein
VILYAESSAVLAWLFDEPRGEEMRALLAAAEQVVSSELTLIECDRVLRRSVAVSGVPEADAADLRGVLASAARGWHVLNVGGQVVERARAPFPDEPVRTLDAIHLASALLAASAFADVHVLSLDDRIRLNARSMGLRVVPN